MQEKTVHVLITVNLLFHTPVFKKWKQPSAYQLKKGVNKNVIYSNNGILLRIQIAGISNLILGQKYHKL